MSGVLYDAWARAYYDCGGVAYVVRLEYVPALASDCDVVLLSFW